jgi:hypothetical protein
MLDDFILDPFKAHEVYNNSFLKMSPAPEYANGEVMLAALYRKVGFQGTDDATRITERVVPKYGRDFQKKLLSSDRKDDHISPSGMPTNIWRRLIETTLRSPLQPNQSTRKYLQISPIVPDACIYSLTPRQTANSWDAGALIISMLHFSGQKQTALEKIWTALFEVLTVGPNDDIWAQFLQKELESWRPADLKKVWQISSIPNINSKALSWNEAGIEIPASRFFKDLQSIIALKNYLTRRQWITMIESVLRIGSASHILWLCKANERTFLLMRQALFGDGPADITKINDSFGMTESFWRYGTKAAEPIKKSAIDYLKARVGINLILYQLQDQFGPSGLRGGLSNPEELGILLKWIGSDKVQSTFDHDKFRKNFQTIIESNVSAMEAKKGIASNITEFLRHVLGQRQTNEVGLDTYDQGFFLGKAGNYKSAPWQLRLGPVSVMTVVHACTHDSKGPRTLNNFCSHLKQYGIEIDPDDVSNSELGNTMRSLGLVLDSPDAEGGIALINPFDYVSD